MANGSNLTPLAVKLGMRYYEEQNLLFGSVGGFECAVREQPDKKMMMVHVVAKPASGEATGMENLLEHMKEEQEAVSAAVYENFTASLRLNTAVAQDPQQLAGEILRQIIDFARQRAYQPCCSGCGRTKDIRRFLLDGGARMLCPACRAKAEAELTDQWQRKKFSHHSPLKGFIVVLLVLLIGATAWIGIYTSGHSAMLVGVAMTILSFLGYQYMAGRMKKGSVIGILLGILVTVFVCHNLCVAFELVVAIGQQQEITITSALFFIPTFLKDPTNREVYFLQLGLSVLAAALAAAPMLWMVHYSWHHKERLESLEEPTA
ncbi:MAG: hypothetical protein PHE47_02185 [Oscillospiraceae bacterium]|nr:hypothetical protein [Oscillospiraceae bacterium]